MNDFLCKTIQERVLLCYCAIVFSILFSIIYSQQSFMIIFHSISYHCEGVPLLVVHTVSTRWQQLLPSSARWSSRCATTLRTTDNTSSVYSSSSASTCWSSFTSSTVSTVYKLFYCEYMNSLTHTVITCFIGINLEQTTPVRPVRKFHKFEEKSIQSTVRPYVITNKWIWSNSSFLHTILFIKFGRLIMARQHFAIIVVFVRRHFTDFAMVLSVNIQGARLRKLLAMAASTLCSATN